MKIYLVYSIESFDGYTQLISAHKNEQNAKKQVESLTSAELERVENYNSWVDMEDGSIPDLPHDCIYTYVALDLVD
ncbi:hypothetical protein [Brevibacillus laterosporus]|uniref:hypothetical protein n=1 Tax=Brevibacillus laterosporus TaxID=1465 RepID=UPI000E6CF532|nr:hypothetical protein [Brevibacillus laterosporus]AYB37639.1 hypothetical protein D5F52_04705 [Brevibacillus laterosporus]MBM7110886.1 hypothetical protein [Brevibacillus laterosporus]